MVKQIKPLEEEEEGNNVIPFSKPDRDGTDVPWLLELKDGTIFLTRERNDKNNFVLAEFQKIGVKNKNVLLTADPAQYTWVDAERFSKRFELVEYWNIPLQKNKNNEGEDDGESNPT